MNTPYCLFEDVLRRFDPTTDPSDFEQELQSRNPKQKYEAAIENKSNEFEQKTGHAWRETRVGSPDAEETYEYHGEDYDKFRRGVKVWLDHREVLPLDPDKGDSLEVRTGRNNWRDVTDQAGDRYGANYPEGWIRIYAGFRTPARWNREIEDRNIRVSYRYGSLGGDRGRGGETRLSGSVDDSGGVLPVEDASRLPAHGLVTLGGSEYARFSGADHGAEELTGVSRGVRATDAQAHDAGDTVHYCPLPVREAVAAGVACEMITYDDWTDILVDADAGLSHSDKREQWNKEFEREAARRAEAHMV